MINQDAGVNWRPGHLYIPITSFSGLVTVMGIRGETAAASRGIDIFTVNNNFFWTAGGTTTFASSSAVTIQAEGTPSYAGNPTTKFLAAVSTGVPLIGMVMAGQGDDVQHFQMLPADLDITRNIYFRVWWTSEARAAGARSLTWRVRYGQVIPGETVAVSASRTLDTAILAQASSGTYLAIERTGAVSRGVIVGGSLAHSAAAIMLRVDSETIQSFTERKLLLGLEMSYTPKRFAGVDGMRHEAKEATALLGNHYDN